MSMPKITIIYAIALILLGLISYLASGMVSITALIPTFFGIVMLLVGVVALSEITRRHAMHVASLLGLVGFIATVSGIFAVISMLSGEAIARPGAAVSKAIMAIFSLIYFALCLWSFVSARLIKKKDNPQPLSAED
jgi:O-antigen/teichoic acid export membrane protein